MYPFQALFLISLRKVHDQTARHIHERERRVDILFVDHAPFAAVPLVQILVLGLRLVGVGRVVLGPFLLRVRLLPHALAELAHQPLVARALEVDHEAVLFDAVQLDGAVHPAAVVGPDVGAPPQAGDAARVRRAHCGGWAGGGYVVAGPVGRVERRRVGHAGAGGHCAAALP